MAGLEVAFPIPRCRSLAPAIGFKPAPLRKAPGAVGYFDWGSSSPGQVPVALANERLAP
jgi:hypothetical protein